MPPPGLSRPPPGRRRRRRRRPASSAPARVRPDDDDDDDASAFPFLVLWALCGRGSRGVRSWHVADGAPTKRRWWKKADDKKSGKH
jgi:hypothetical protein